MMSTDGKNSTGALSSEQILELIENGSIIGAGKEYISPASLDLTVSPEAYRVDSVFLPRVGERVRDVLASAQAFRHDLGNPLERDVAYLFRLNESLKLPSTVYGYCNPKSSTGRNDVHVRVLADGVPRYDSINPRGFAGELWILVTPRSFPVRISCGTPLSQLRLFNGDTRFTQGVLAQNFDRFGLLFDLEGNKFAYKNLKITDEDGAVVLTLDLSQDIVGYECHGLSKVLDMAKEGEHCDPDDFFRPMRSENGKIHLKKGGFYILSSAEAVRVPPDLACEMIPMDERSGEFRSHYAGFIDPGWGWGKKGEGAGRPLTLEVRPFEDLIIRHGQPIGKLRFESMAKIPKVLYDTKGSNYIAQRGPRLSKFFKVSP